MDKEMFLFNRNAIAGRIAEPLCTEYKSAWRQCGDDKELLMRLALQQQSLPYLSYACYEGLGLTKEYLIENFASLINGKRTFDGVDGVQGYTSQMYVGYDKDFKVTADVTAIMWCDNTQIQIKATKCPILYVSNSSNVHVVCDGFNSPRIYLFDDSKVTIEDCDDTCEVIIYKYSDKAEVELGKFCFGKVNVFNKQLRL